jgi:hypothetical protein
MSLTKEIEKASQKAAMMGAAMRDHRQRSGELRDPERSEPKSVRAHANAIPRRGVLDEDGSIFQGYKGDIIEENGITAQELKTTGDAATERAVNNAAMRSDAVDERVIGPQALRFSHFPIRNVEGGAGNVNALPVDVKADANNIRGELNTANIPALGPDKVPGIGSLNGTLSYGALSNKPDLSKFLVSNDIQHKAGKKWVEDYVRKHVKKTARI